MKYRKKPVVIEAFKLNARGLVYNDPAWCEIKTLEGTMIARAGDYIIRGVNGGIYPCKPDIFEKTYEAIE